MLGCLSKEERRIAGEQKEFCQLPTPTRICFRIGLSGKAIRSVYDKTR